MTLRRIGLSCMTTGMSHTHRYFTVNSNQLLHYPVKPVGVFWDIENCPVPRTESASAVINFIRHFFIVNRSDHREFDFLVACDVTRIKKSISDDINKAGGVTLAHCGTNKNAADEKLRESMKKFVDTHGPSTPTLVLISSDIDFVNDLRGYQTRLGCSIVVLHGPSSSQHFKTGWNEIYSFDNFLKMMGRKKTEKTSLVAPSNDQRTKQIQKMRVLDEKVQPKAKEKQNSQGTSHEKQTKGLLNNDRKKNIEKIKLKASNKGQVTDRIENTAKLCSNRSNATKVSNSSGRSEIEQNTLASSPSKQPVQVQEKKEWILVVNGLPGKMNNRALHESLQSKALQVKGLVKLVTNGQGFISFRKKEDFEKALTLFDGMGVYGKKLIVDNCYKIPSNQPKQEANRNKKGNERRKEPDKVPSLLQNLVN